jgi:hypothetical protein
MLHVVKTKEFKNKFLNQPGTVFYIYRDDAVGLSAGKLSWVKGQLKYVLENNRLLFKGKFSTAEKKSVLPSSFTTGDFILTAEIFKEVQNTLKQISSNLNFKIFIQPFSFTALEISQFLEKYKLNYTNGYFIDIFHKKHNSLFLDGHFNENGNQILAENLLDWSLIQTGTKGMIKEKIEIKSFAEKAIEFHRGELSLKNINVFK